MFIVNLCFIDTDIYLHKIVPTETHRRLNCQYFNTVAALLKTRRNPLAEEFIYLATSAECAGL